MAGNFMDVLSGVVPGALAIASGNPDVAASVARQQDTIQQRQVKQQKEAALMSFISEAQQVKDERQMGELVKKYAGQIDPNEMASHLQNWNAFQKNLRDKKEYERQDAMRTLNETLGLKYSGALPNDMIKTMSDAEEHIGQYKAIMADIAGVPNGMLTDIYNDISKRVSLAEEKWWTLKKYADEQLQDNIAKTERQRDYNLRMQQFKSGQTQKIDMTAPDGRVVEDIPVGSDLYIKFKAQGYKPGKTQTGKGYGVSKGEETALKAEWEDARKARDAIKKQIETKMTPDGTPLSAVDIGILTDATLPRLEKEVQAARAAMVSGGRAQGTAQDTTPGPDKDAPPFAAGLGPNAQKLLDSLTGGGREAGSEKTVPQDQLKASQGKTELPPKTEPQYTDVKVDDRGVVWGVTEKGQPTRIAKKPSKMVYNGKFLNDKWVQYVQLLQKHGIVNKDVREYREMVAKKDPKLMRLMER